MLEIGDFILKCQADFILNLETVSQVMISRNGHRKPPSATTGLASTCSLKLVNNTNNSDNINNECTSNALNPSVIHA